MVFMGSRILSRMYVAPQLKTRKHNMMVEVISNGACHILVFSSQIVRYTFSSSMLVVLLKKDGKKSPVTVRRLLVQLLTSGSISGYWPLPQ